MTNRADELLRELLACRDAMKAKNWIIDPEEALSVRYQSAFEAARAYLNEKPHEPPHAPDKVDRCELVKLLRDSADALEYAGGYIDGQHETIDACMQTIKDAGVAQRVRGAGAEGAAGGSPQGLNDSQRDRAVCPDDRKSDPASPPHAAAEPEKPIAWYMPIGGRHSIIEWGPKRPDRVGVVEWHPLYASPSAQPIAREPTGKMLRAMHNALAIAGGWVNDETLTAMWRAALKSAGKESTK